MGKIGATFLILFIIYASRVEAASNKPGATAANFLKIGMSSRAVALGDAFCAIADDISAIYYNPAGLAQIDKCQIAFGGKDWIENTNAGYLSCLYPIGKGAIGMSIIYFNEGKMQEITRDKIITGKEFKAQDLCLIMSFSHNLRTNLLLGANLKYIKQQIAEFSGKGIAGDIGLLYKFSDALNLGMKLQNAGQKIMLDKEKASLPLNIAAGVSLKHKGLTMNMDINKPIDNNLMLSFGLEYKIIKPIALRVGYKDYLKAQKVDLYEKDIQTGLTAGFGIAINQRYLLDYAYVPYGDLGITHQISLLIKFNFPKTLAVKPEAEVSNAR